MDRYKEVLADLSLRPRRWLITGVAGFIGSNILEELLKNDQIVVGLDNYETGCKENLKQVQGVVTERQWKNFLMIEGDIRDPKICSYVCNKNIDYVLHQAALGSVPRSLEDPLATNSTNIDGFLNMLVAAKNAKVKSFTYAASSSTYGDHPGLPKTEDIIGKPLSPYAVTKYVNELYAEVFARCYDFHSIGLRYFNVFGARQDPDGAYAAVIPKWIAALMRKETIYINGDGNSSRDFCYVANVIQANLLAATSTSSLSTNQVYNIAVGQRTSLNDLFAVLCEHLELRDVAPVYRDFRTGDVRHSQADVSKANSLLGYLPRYKFSQGIREAIKWYKENVV